MIDFLKKIFLFIPISILLISCGQDVVKYNDALVNANERLLDAYDLYDSLSTEYIGDPAGKDKCENALANLMKIAKNEIAEAQKLEKVDEDAFKNHFIRFAEAMINHENDFKKLIYYNSIQSDVMTDEDRSMEEELYSKVFDNLDSLSGAFVDFQAEFAKKHKIELQDSKNK